MHAMNAFFFDELKLHSGPFVVTIDSLSTSSVPMLDVTLFKGHRCATERRVDYAEGRADALSIADKSDKPSLADEIAALEGADAIDDELEQMKKALGKNGASKED